MSLNKLKIAIFGATSQIAKDLIFSLSVKEKNELYLFSRDLNILKKWLEYKNINNNYKLLDYLDFNASEKFDVVINFIGVGDPAKALGMGTLIFDVTLKYDMQILGYLEKNSECKYIFLSSGAVYGSSFDTPVDVNSKAIIPINDFKQQDWYGAAKLYAECRHRALPEFSIIDIRLFNYYSYSQNISSRFLISDAVRAIQFNTVLITSSYNIIRDYIGPHDFYSLVSLLIASPHINDAVDSYTKEPIDKFTLLLALKEKFGLKYEVDDTPLGLNASGMKINYFSKNMRASQFGYSPIKTSLSSVLEQSELLLENMK